MSRRKWIATARMMKPGIKEWGEIRGVPFTKHERAMIFLAVRRHGVDAAIRKIKAAVYAHLSRT